MACHALAVVAVESWISASLSVPLPSPSTAIWIVERAYAIDAVASTLFFGSRRMTLPAAVAVVVFELPLVTTSPASAIAVQSASLTSLTSSALP